MEAGKVRKLEPTPGWCERAYERLDRLMVAGKHGWRLNSVQVRDTQQLIDEFVDAQQPAPACDCAEQRARGWRQVCDVCQGPSRPDKPEAEKRPASPVEAEELPSRVPFQLIAAAHSIAAAEADGDVKEIERALTLAFRELLAECRRIARDEVTQAWVDSKPADEVARIAREEIVRAVRRHCEECGHANEVWIEHLADRRIAAARWERYDNGPRMVGFEGEWKDASEVLRLRPATEPEAPKEK